MSAERERLEEKTVNYELAYRVGFHPWEDAEAHSPFTEKISELFGQEESGRGPPYGPALDLGTGSGIWAVQLAKRGWQVTGVELVEKASRSQKRCWRDDRTVQIRPAGLATRPGRWLSRELNGRASNVEAPEGRLRQLFLDQVYVSSVNDAL